MRKTPEEILEDNGYDIEELGECGTILFRSPDYASAIIGITYHNHVVYDYEKMVEFLISEENMDFEEAVDFIDYNASFGFSEGLVPIIMYPIKQG